MNLRSTILLIVLSILTNDVKAQGNSSINLLSHDGIDE